VSAPALAAAHAPGGRYAGAFAGVVGHAGPVRVLTASLAAGRVPHALLFHGPAGVGKATAADRLAAALLCQGEGERPCGVCAPCGRLAHGNAYDRVRLEPDGAWIKIEQVRALQERMTAATGGVVTVEPADALNPAAANALLKTLEEPPPGWTLVLVTARPESVLATIRSRCQAVRFGRLSPADTASVLAAHGVSGPRAPLLAHLAEGAPGAVLAAGVAPEELVAECSEAFAVLAPEALHSPARIFSAAEAWGRDPDRTRRFLRRVQMWVSEALHPSEGEPLGAVPTAGDGGDTGNGAASPAAWGRRFPPGFLASFTLAVQEAEERLERNVNRPTTIEALLVTLRGGLLPTGGRP
jgi:DNA polymerase-3 subunit delta'